MIGWPNLPYEAVGKLVVVLIAVAVVVLIALGLVVAALFVWVRFWTKVINLAWGGYDPLGDEKPPLWRRRIAIVAYGLHNLKRPSEIHEKIKMVHEEKND